MTLLAARISLFVIWLALFATYVLSFLLISGRPGISAAEANEAAWTAAYILGPVLTAFGVFYLGPDAVANLAANPGKRVLFQQVFVMLLLTFVMHGIVLVYFYKNVWASTAQFNFPQDPASSFTGIVNFGFKLLLFFGTIPIVAVNFVLGATVQLGAPTGNQGGLSPVISTGNQTTGQPSAGNQGSS